VNDPDELPQRIQNLIAYLPTVQAMIQKFDGKLGDLCVRLSDGRFTPAELDTLATLAAGCVDACETGKQRIGELATWSQDRLDEAEQSGAGE